MCSELRYPFPGGVLSFSKLTIEKFLRIKMLNSHRNCSGIWASSAFRLAPYKPRLHDAILSATRHKISQDNEEMLQPGTISTCFHDSSRDLKKR